MNRTAARIVAPLVILAAAAFATPAAEAKAPSCHGVISCGHHWIPMPPAETGTFTPGTTPAPTGACGNPITNIPCHGQIWTP